MRPVHVLENTPAEMRLRLEPWPRNRVVGLVPSASVSNRSFRQRHVVLQAVLPLSLESPAYDPPTSNNPTAPNGNVLLECLQPMG